MNGMFHASIRLWDRDVSLGFFDTALEAAVAHDQGMQMFYGPKSKVALNFKNGKRDAVKRQVASLLAHKKQEKSANEGKQPASAKTDDINVILDIPEEAAVTMMGFDSAPADVSGNPRPSGRSRHQLCSCKAVGVDDSKGEGGN